VRLHDRRASHHFADRLVHVGRDGTRMLRRRVALERVLFAEDLDPRAVFRAHRDSPLCC
jgi:hypothetical protein